MSISAELMGKIDKQMGFLEENSDFRLIRDKLFNILKDLSKKESIDIDLLSSGFVLKIKNIEQRKNFLFEFEKELPGFFKSSSIFGVKEDLNGVRILNKKLLCEERNKIQKLVELNLIVIAPEQLDFLTKLQSDILTANNTQKFLALKILSKNFLQLLSENELLNLKNIVSNEKISNLILSGKLSLAAGLRLDENKLANIEKYSSAILNDMISVDQVIKINKNPVTAFILKNLFVFPYSLINKTGEIEAIESFLHFFNLKLKNLKDVDSKEIKTFQELYNNHEGVCDLICNYLTLVKAFDEKKISQIKEIIFKKNILNYNNDLILDKVELLAKTHILLSKDLSSFIESKIIPASILEDEEHNRLIDFNLYDTNLNLNTKILDKNFAALEQGTYVKFSLYKTENDTPSNGHSILIYKKNNTSYLIIDPSERKIILRDFCHLSTELNLIYQKYLSNCSYDQVALIDNTKFLNSTDQDLIARLLSNNPKKLEEKSNFQDNLKVDLRHSEQIQFQFSPSQNNKDEMDIFKVKDADLGNLSLRDNSKFNSPDKRESFLVGAKGTMFASSSSLEKNSKLDDSDENRLYKKTL